MGKRASVTGHAVQRGRLAHRFYATTSLAGTAAALLLGTPSHAATARSMTLDAISLVQAVPRATGARAAFPQDLTIRRTGAAPGFAMASAGRIADTPVHASVLAPVQDLTIAATGPITGSDITVAVGTVVTTGDFAHGVDTLATGNTTITADSITTAGLQADGIHALGGGDISIKAGTVATNGDYAAGIYAVSNGPTAHDIAITAGTINTRGSASDGIDAINYGGGKIGLTVDRIATSGDGSWGIYAGGLGDIAIKAGSVETSGAFAAAIGVTSVYGSIDITADTVATHGDHANAVNAANYSQAGATTITVGSVSTDGAGSVGIYAGGSASYQGATHAVTINAGSVTTKGTSTAGVVVKTSGEITANLGDITIDGDRSRGVILSTDEGDIALNAGNIVTQGKTALGMDESGVVVADNFGKVTADLQSISTAADHSPGILTNGFYSDQSFTIHDAITTTGEHSAGVFAALSYGSLSIDSGAITTTGAQSNGVTSYVSNGDTMIKVGSLATQGDSANGLQLTSGSYDGTSHKVTVDAGTIVTRGDYSSGIVAVSQGSDASLSAQSITTSGIAAAGIVAIAYNGADLAGNPIGGNIAIQAGTVATSGERADGIYAVAYEADKGDITITADTVKTSGNSASGIYAVSVAPGDVSISAGTIATTGDGSFGVVAQASGGKATVTGDTISTTGLNARGIIASSAYGTTITAANVSTQGDYAIAIGAYGEGTVAVTTTGEVATRGFHAYGVFANGGLDSSITVDNTGKISTAGENAAGIYGLGVEARSVTVTNSGAIAVSGSDAAAIRAMNNGAVTVSNTGSVAAAGAYGVGIVASGAQVDVQSSGQIVTSGADAIGILAIGPSIVTSYDPANGPALAINAVSVSTSGSDSSAILARSLGGISIDAGHVSSAGTDSMGIVAEGGSDIHIAASEVSSTAAAIYAVGRGKGAVSIDVAGPVTSHASDAIFAANAAGATTITVGAGASVAGAADAMQIESGSGPIEIANAGTLSAGRYAIEVGGLTGALLSDATSGVSAAPAGTSITNGGTIIGAVRLSQTEDTLDNSGTFVATRDSDFGGGGDRFINSGTLVVRPADKAGKVTFQNLATFQNAGGLIDLRNGVAGNVLSLSGAYVGSGGAHLGVDLGGAAADRLEIAGAATGETGIILAVTGEQARLLAGPITLVQSGPGSISGAFAVTNADIGLIHYGLGYDAKTGAYDLTSQAGAPVYRMLSIPRAALAVWQRAADAWDSHMSEKRDARLAGADDFGRRLWGQAYGGVDTQTGHRDIDADRADTSYRQDYYGAQIGFDLGGKATDKGGMLYGVTASYISSRLSSRASADRGQLETVTVGAYASFLSGPFFGNLLGQYGHDRIRASNVSLDYADKLSANSYGAMAQIGLRLGDDRMFIEPSGALSFVRSDIGDLHALGQTIDFDRQNGLHGKIGGRVGRSAATAGGGKTTFYLDLHYVHEFKASSGLDLLSADTRQHVPGVRPGDYGQGALGMNILTMGPFSGFIEGDADVGGGTRGGGARVGFSVKL